MEAKKYKHLKPLSFSFSTIFYNVEQGKKERVPSINKATII